jgi:DNA-directed RNA polymerase II subunit RPB1
MLGALPSGPPTLLTPLAPLTHTEQVVIQDGQVLAGTLCKKTLGAAAGGLVHITWMEYGPEAARALLSQASQGRGAPHMGGIVPRARRLVQWAALLSVARSHPPPPPFAPPQIQFTVNHWLLQHGFSIGIGDLIADQRTMEIINDIMERAKADVKKLIEKVQTNDLEQQPGRTIMESFENQASAPARPDTSLWAAAAGLAPRAVPGEQGERRRRPLPLLGLAPRR